MFYRVFSLSQSNSFENSSVNLPFSQSKGLWIRKCLPTIQAPRVSLRRTEESLVAHVLQTRLELGVGEESYHSVGHAQPLTVTKQDITKEVPRGEPARPPEIYSMFLRFLHLFTVIRALVSSSSAPRESRGSACTTVFGFSSSSAFVCPVL